MKKKFIFFINIIFIFFFIGTLNLKAQEPKLFIQNIINEAKDILKGTNSKEYKSENLTKLAIKTVDIKGIGMYTLGSYRKQLNDEQKKKYTNLFEKYFLKTFVSRLTDYSDPKINIVSAEKKNDKYTIVFSVLEATSKKPEVKIDWRVYTKNPEKPLIRDLIIEGLSLARTQQEEFASIMESNSGDINALFKKLEEFINS